MAYDGQRFQWVVVVWMGGCQMVQGLVLTRMMALGLGAALLVSPLAHRPAHAGSGRPALAGVAGAVLGAAMLGVLSQAQAPQPPAAPPSAGAPKKQKSAAKSSASNKVAPAAPKSDLTNSNVDPFAAGGSSVQVVDKP